MPTSDAGLRRREASRPGQEPTQGRLSPVHQAKAIDWLDLLRIPLWLALKPLYSVAPPTVLFRLAGLWGRLDTWFSPLHAEVLSAVSEHLGERLTEPEQRLVARRYLQMRRKSRFARLWPQVRSFVDSESIPVEGREHLDGALAAGRGAVLISAHFGYARLIKPILRAHGSDVLLVGIDPERHGPQDFPPYFTRFGSYVHTRLLRLPRASALDERWNRTVGGDLGTGINLQAHLAALDANRPIAVLADGRAAHVERYVSVLGVEVQLASGPVSLCRKTGASLLPVFAIDDPTSEGPGNIKLLICEPLELQVTDDAGADLQANLEAFAAVYERVTLRHPHNFTWAWVANAAFSNPFR